MRITLLKSDMDMITMGTNYVLSTQEDPEEIRGVGLEAGNCANFCYFFDCFSNHCLFLAFPGTEEAVEEGEEVLSHARRNTEYLSLVFRNLEVGKI